MFRSNIIAGLSAVCVSVYLIAGMATPCWGAAGDIYFSTPDQKIEIDLVNQQALSANVFLHADGVANVPATAWGLIVNIAPETGAVGTLQFDPPVIVNDEPNLSPSSKNPFRDFDRDFGGMSYGQLGLSSTELRALSVYVEPTNGPVPPLDTDSNLSFPNGSGLFSLPLLASAGASGDFIISFGTDPELTGVVFNTGQPPPNDHDMHPLGNHVSGTLSLITPGHLVWDGLGDGSWSENRWQPGDTSPTDADMATIVNDKVTVSDAENAWETVVDSGQLEITASGTLASPLTVNFGSLLTGGGTIIGDVIQNGTLRVGDTAASLNVELHNMQISTTVSSSSSIGFGAKVDSTTFSSVPEPSNLLNTVLAFLLLASFDLSLVIGYRHEFDA